MKSIWVEIREVYKIVKAGKGIPNFKETAMNENDQVDPAIISKGLAFIRKRRLFLWGVVAIYVPAIWLTLRITHSDRAAGAVFAGWVILLVIAVFRAAFVRCPRCGNTFHMHGFTPMYLRKCLHCGLHVCADKREKRRSVKSKDLTPLGGGG